MMITRAFIQKKIRRELVNEKYQVATLHFLENFLLSERPEKFLSIYELSGWTGETLSNEEVLNLAFLLASMSLPILEVFIEFENEFMEKDEIKMILQQEPIGHPISGELIEFSEYKNQIALYFKFNEEIWRQLNQVK